MGCDTRRGRRPGADAAAAAQHALPVNLMANNVLEQARALAARHADVQIVIDHVGMGQAVEPPGKPDPFADLPKLLALAPYENVAVKLSGAVTMSKEPYPFRDLWDSLARIFDAFGFDRCLWGTDWTRALAFASYREMVDAFRLTDRLTADERAALMGGSLQKVYRWTPGVASRP
jgi:L-fuconolactonase